MPQRHSHTLLTIRGGGGALGGANSATTSTQGGEDSMGMPQGAAAVLASFWGTAGVLYILGKAIKRVVPIALEPFQDGAVPLSQVQLGCVVDMCLDEIMAFHL